MRLMALLFLATLLSTIGCKAERPDTKSKPPITKAVPDPPEIRNKPGAETPEEDKTPDATKPSP